MFCIFDPRREECSRNLCAGAWFSAHASPPGCLGLLVPGQRCSTVKAMKGTHVGPAALDWVPRVGGVLSCHPAVWSC